MRARNRTGCVVGCGTGANRIGRSALQHWRHRAVRRFTKERRAQIGAQLCLMAQKMGHSLQVAGVAA
ncbi:hypothetical protein GN286_04800 [Rhodobacteraceae bacterium IMCC15231]|nr:hypothetical protein [Rhodobacteraceae bacterium IMCC15231]